MEIKNIIKIDINNIDGRICMQFNELEDEVVRKDPNFMYGDGTCKYKNHIFNPENGSCNNCKHYGGRN